MPRVVPDFEEELRFPVRAHFERQGYEVRDEVKIHTRVCDLFCVGRDLVAVELKLSSWRAAARQALAYQLGANRSYIAVPRVTAARVLRDVDAFRRAGVGVLTVDPLDAMAVRELLPATDSDRFLPYLGDALREGEGGVVAWRARERSVKRGRRFRR
ncbi:MAG: hypothetical protein ACT4PT_09005 [Methanobacteriota archaeon]